MISSSFLTDHQTILVIDASVAINLNAIGCNAQAEAIYNALLAARMRVPEEKLSSVISVIGRDRAVKCASLPKAARIASLIESSTI